MPTNAEHWMEEEPVADCSDARLCQNSAKILATAENKPDEHCLGIYPNASHV